MDAQPATSKAASHPAATVAAMRGPVVVDHAPSRPAWTPSPSIALSIALHGVAGAGVLAVPSLWPWALGTVAANHLGLTLAGLWPRSTLLGPNIVRLPQAAVARRQVALTLDDGPDPETTPRVLDLLDAAGVKASFFCIGRRARQHPAVCREIVARGHRVENHGDTHYKHFATYGWRRLREDIAAAQATLADITGQRPRFFRPLGGLRSPLLDPVLAHLDLKLVSWTRRGLDSLQGDAARVHDRLVRGLAPGAILLLHDADCATTPAGAPVVLEVLPGLIASMQSADLHPVTLAQAVP